MKIHINQFFACVVLVLCAVAATSCNSDLFIDADKEMPDDVTVYVAGDNGLAEVPIQPKGLQHIYVDEYSSAVSSYKYFNHNSEEVSADVPASEISQIWYYEPMCEFSIGLTGDRILISTYQNCAGSERTVSLRLEYDYGVKYINVHIAKGAPLEFLLCEYQGDFEIIENFRTEQSTMTIDNKGGNPSTVYVKPYQNYSIVGLIKPDESWADYRQVEVAIPYYFESEDEWFLHDIGDLTLMDTFYYDTYNKDKTVPVEIPANSKIRIIINVSFSRATSQGELLFRAPVSDNQFTVNYDCTVIQPVSYQIEIVEL